MTWSNDPKKNRAFTQGEVGKIRWAVLPFTQGLGLDLGCSRWKLWPESIGIDAKGPAANLGGDVTCLQTTADACYDYVFSSHTLEDIEDTLGTLAEWWRVLRVGGHLVLYLPHKALYPNIGEPGGNPAHAHDFLPEDIELAMHQVAPDWVQRVDQVRGAPGDRFADEYSFLQVYTKAAPGTGQRRELEVDDPANRCIVVRGGGIGDVLVAAGTFPALKAEGLHLTVYTSALGAQVLAHNPHVDRIVEHEFNDLRPADHLTFFAHLRGECARFVNFSETFENLLLASPKRVNFYWPHAMRHHYLNGNYQEAAHRAAGVPLSNWRQEFFATVREQLNTAEWRRDMRCLVVLVPASKGVNKNWPHWQAYARELVARNSDVHVALLGQLPEAPALQHPRIHTLGERWPLRAALALAQQADLVIGQETGILNAVAHERMPKIVLLSHSSAENLTAHWHNTRVLAGAAACHPCHRMHMDWQGCQKDAATGAALCQSLISAADALDATEQLLALDERQAEAMAA